MNKTIHPLVAYFKSRQIWWAVGALIIIGALVVFMFWRAGNSQDWIGSTIKQAEQFYLENRLADAQAKYQLIVDRYPNEVKALNALGNTLREQGNLRGAEEKYLKVIDIDPGYEPVYRNLLAVYQMWDKADEQTARIASFAPIMERGLSYRPQSVQIIATAVDYYRQVGNDAKAAELKRQMDQIK